jgi:hypothetical protein
LQCGGGRDDYRRRKNEVMKREKVRREEKRE